MTERSAKSNADATVRRARESDLAAVTALMNGQNRYHAEIVPAIIKRADRATTEAWCRSILADPAYELFIAERADAPVGILMLHEQEIKETPVMHGKRLAFVDELFVVEEARRQGIARALIAAALAHAKSRGRQELSLKVWGANLPAQKFYEKLGFAPIEHQLALPVD